MAGHAIGGARKIFAALDRIGIGEILRNAGRIGAVVIRERDRVAAGESQRPRVESFQHENSRGNQDDEDDDARCGLRMTLTPS